MYIVWHQVVDVALLLRQQGHCGEGKSPSPAKPSICIRSPHGYCLFWKNDCRLLKWGLCLAPVAQCPVDPRNSVVSAQLAGKTAPKQLHVNFHQ